MNVAKAAGALKPVKRDAKGAREAFMPPGRVFRSRRRAIHDGMATGGLAPRVISPPVVAAAARPCKAGEVATWRALGFGNPPAG